MNNKKFFVFGSNKAGRHGAGAALCARKKWGAKYVVGSGRTGMSHAIPTKGFNLEVLSLEEIKNGVDEFISYANDNPDLEFHVTRVFKNAPSNCYFEQSWLKHINGDQDEQHENRSGFAV